jgi:hypothetical protein
VVSEVFVTVLYKFKVDPTKATKVELRSTPITLPILVSVLTLSVPSIFAKVFGA